MQSSSPDLANVVEWLSLQTAAQAATQAEAFRQMQLETERQLQAQRIDFQRELAATRWEMLEETRRELRALRIASPVPSATEQGEAATSPSPELIPRRFRTLWRLSGPTPMPTTSNYFRM